MSRQRIECIRSSTMGDLMQTINRLAEIATIEHFEMFGSRAAIVLYRMDETLPHSESITDKEQLWNL